MNHPSPSTTPRPPNPAKLIIVTALVSVFITSLSWIGIGVFAYTVMTREPPAFALELNHPETAQVGETLDLRVLVRNDSSKSMRLQDLDLYDSLLDGFTVLKVHPKPKSKQHLLGINTYSFGRALKPSETIHIEFTLQAKEAGQWGGEIDACTPTQNFVTQYAEIKVIDPRTPPSE